MSDVWPFRSKKMSKWNEFKCCWDHVCFASRPFLYLFKKRVQVILKQTSQEESMNPFPAAIKLSKKQCLLCLCQGLSSIESEKTVTLNLIYWKSWLHKYAAYCIIFICCSFAPSAKVKHTHTRLPCFPSVSLFVFSLLTFHLYPNKSSLPQGFRSQRERHLFLSVLRILTNCFFLLFR